MTTLAEIIATNDDTKAKAGAFGKEGAFNSVDIEGTFTGKIAEPVVVSTDKYGEAIVLIIKTPQGDFTSWFFLDDAKHQSNVTRMMAILHKLGLPTDKEDHNKSWVASQLASLKDRVVRFHTYFPVNPQTGVKMPHVNVNIDGNV